MESGGGPRSISSDMFPMRQADLAQGTWKLESKVKLKLLDRIREAGTPLRDYVGDVFTADLRRALMMLLS